MSFENRFRGDSEGLKANQERYLSLFPPAALPGRILDVGCGRGEMVELLRDAGHDAFGVDADEGMAAACRDRGIPVVQDNALHLLERLEDGSLKGIFSAQVVEHLLLEVVSDLASRQRIERAAKAAARRLRGDAWKEIANESFTEDRIMKAARQVLKLAGWPIKVKPTK